MIKKINSIAEFYILLEKVTKLRNPIFRGHSSVKYE